MYTIAQIAETVNGKIDGNPELAIKGVCDIANGAIDHLSYIASEKYEDLIHKSKATAILVGNDFTIDREAKTLIYVENPAISFIDVIHLFHPKESTIAQIHSSAIIPPTVEMGENIHMAPYVVCEENIKIGDGVRIGAGTFKGKTQLLTMVAIFIQM